MAVKRTDGLFGRLMLGIGTVGFLMVLYLSFSAVRTLGEHYTEMKQADLSQVYSGTVYYDDSLYACTGYGIETDPADPDTPKILQEYLDSSLTSIDQVILSVGAVYTMFIASFAAFYQYINHQDNHRGHVRSILLGGILVYVLYTAAIVLMYALNHIPFLLPDARSLLDVGVSLLSVLGGLCALGLLIRIIPLKKIASLAAIPLVFVLFLFSAVSEGQLCLPAYQKSFAYLAEIDSRVLEEDFDGYYYDEEKDVVVLDGKEYPPQIVPNPDYLTGTDRVKAYVFEALDPFSGSAFSMMEKAAECQAPLIYPACYALKALFWIILAGKRKSS